MRVRVGIVDYLNSKPLAWAFLSGTTPGTLEPSFLPPARVAERLAAGELDVGLLPSIELQRIPDLEVLPGLCVAARREVRSVLLVSRGPIAAIRRVALDENSRTSAALVEILLRDRYGLRPELETAPADLDRMLAGHDAALLIGDPALRVERGAYRVLDLAREWRRLTGHPFVFAVWAARRGLEHPDLTAVFRRSLLEGREAIERLIEESTAELGLAPAAVREYLTENLCFELGEAELLGLKEFFRRARVHDLIPDVRPLRFRAEPA